LVGFPEFHAGSLARGETALVRSEIRRRSFSASAA
jgi:hypothetical protein